MNIMFTIVSAIYNVFLMSQQWGQDPIFREERLYFEGGGSKGSIALQGHGNGGSEISPGLPGEICHLPGILIISPNHEPCVGFFR